MLTVPVLRGPPRQGHWPVGLHRAASAKRVWLAAVLIKQWVFNAG